MTKLVVVLIAIFAVLAVSVGQSPPGGVGGGGGTNYEGWTVEVSEKTGSDIVIVPKFDSAISDWRLYVYQRDWATNSWTIDGDPVSGMPTIPLTWWAGKSFTGSYQCCGSIKLKLKWNGVASEVPSSLWVAVSSNAHSEGSASPVLVANNGFDEEIKLGTHDDSFGTHLKRVSVNSDKEATYTVSVNAKASVTGSTGYVSASVGARMIPDPRRISVPSNYRRENSTETELFQTNYYKYKQKTTFVAPDVDTGEKIPELETKPISTSYAKALRVKNELDYSDYLTVKGTYVRGLHPNRRKQIFGVSNQTETEGGLTTTILFWAYYSGAGQSESVAWWASHNNGSGSGTSQGSAGSTDNISSTLTTDAEDVVHLYNPVTNKTTVTHQPSTVHQSTGNFASKFSFEDDLVADAKIDFDYKSEIEPVETIATEIGMPGGATGWQPYVPFVSSDGFTVTDKHLSDFITATGLTAAITLALMPETIPLAVGLSLVGAGIGSWLDSSLNDPQSFTINRSYSYFWDIKTPNWQTLYNDDTAEEVALASAEWSCDLCPKYDITFYVGDKYDDNGFSNRSIVHTLKNKASGMNPGGYRYYHFRDGGSGNT